MTTSSPPRVVRPTWIGWSEYGDRVRAVAMDDPPLRLLLGASAVESAVRSADERTAEARRWAALSRAADFPADFPADLLTAGRPTARP
ncbi:MAG TPA: hypothetical protein VFE65_35385 [Pseudonocardia sp.]|nr:hypothetical protein [Pseudonocardia sp.]